MAERVRCLCADAFLYRASRNPRGFFDAGLGNLDYRVRDRFRWGGVAILETIQTVSAEAVWSASRSLSSGRAARGPVGLQ